MSKLVAIDCGHGMHTGGKRTPKLIKDVVVNGVTKKKKGEIIHENEWNRAVGKYLAEALKRCGVNTMFTSDMTGQEDTPLSTRARKANNKGADLFISCHYNAYGMCSKFLDRKGGLLVLRTKGCSEKSIKLGKAVHKHLLKDVEYKNDFGVCRDVDISGFTLAVLRQTTMPAILIEYGFMDVWREASLMVNPIHQKKCAEATCKGVCEYLGIKYVPSGNNSDSFYIETLAEVNVREKASVESDIIHKAPKGIKYKVTETKNDWGYVPYRKGWVTLNNKFVKKI